MGKINKMSKQKLLFTDHPQYVHHFFLILYTPKSKRFVLSFSGFYNSMMLDLSLFAGQSITCKTFIKSEKNK